MVCSCCCGGTSGRCTSGPPVDACAAAKSAFCNYKYAKGKSRIDEVKLARHASPMTDDASRPFMDDPMFEAIFAAVEESERQWNKVSEFEQSVQQRFEKINKSGRAKLILNTKKSTAVSSEVAADNAIGSLTGGAVEGRKVENDVSVNGFFAMLGELKEHRNVLGYVHRERKVDPTGVGS